MKKILAVAAIALAVLAGEARAQTYSSLGLGIVSPGEDLRDIYDSGITFRGQAGVSLALVDVHLQTGVTSFAYDDSVGADEGDEANLFHIGAGARFNLGMLFVGANGGYFFGDGDDGFGIFPELGVRFWRLEAVADARVEGDQWLAVRLNWTF